MNEGGSEPTSAVGIFPHFPNLPYFPNSSPPLPYAADVCPRNLVLLGSTGSIGTQTLDVVRLFPDRFRVRALTAHANAALLLEQARAFRPELVVIGDEAQAASLEKELRGTDVRVACGEEGLCEAAALEGRTSSWRRWWAWRGWRRWWRRSGRGRRSRSLIKNARRRGALVCGLVERHGARLVPVDSEHSAIFQCLVGEPPESVERLILTASGGPFRTRDPATFADVTPERR